MKMTVLAVFLMITATSVNAQVTSNAESNSRSGVYIGGSEALNNTPGMGAPSGNNTASCIKHFSAGVSVPGFGRVLGIPVTDHSCKVMEEAKMIYDLAGRNAALTHVCRNLPRVRRTLVSAGVCKVVKK